MEFEKLKEIIEEILHIDREAITESSEFVDDLGADSLDLFQILLCLEETYDIEIEEKDAEEIRIVGDAVALICRLIKG